MPKAICDKEKVKTQCTGVPPMQPTTSANEVIPIATPAVEVSLLSFEPECETVPKSVVGAPLDKRDAGADGRGVIGATDGKFDGGKSDGSDVGGESDGHIVGSVVGGAAKTYAPHAMMLGCLKQPSKLRRRVVRELRTRVRTTYSSSSLALYNFCSPLTQSVVDTVNSSSSLSRLS